MPNVRVVPAILTDSPQALETMMRQAETFTDYVQIDIMDGEFVPSHSISWRHIASLPTKLSWEAHLMTVHPEKYLENFKNAGAKKAMFHFEATATPKNVISEARRLGLGIGLAVNPETPITAILHLADEVDSMLFLSVHPGFYGAKFIPEVLDKIVEFRKSMPEVKTGIDGGVKESNIELISRSGVNEIFVGSAIFAQPDPAASYKRLIALAQKARQEK